MELTCDVDYQCGRCGSSLYWDDCPTCEACGFTRDHPDPNCDVCDGHGTAPFCLSSYEFCERNPLEGRENVARHTPEAFTIDGVSVEPAVTPTASAAEAVTVPDPSSADGASAHPRVVSAPSGVVVSADHHTNTPPEGAT